MSSHGNVMVVDDNPDNLKLLEGMLRQHGYEVRSFPRGRLALAAADQEPPDLILLDVNMPEMNGYDVCRQLKASERLSSIPVVFISALDAIEDKVKGFQSGGVDYISKPFQFEEVEARVETHLKLHRAQQAEHELLEKTLGGAVETLWELVQLTSPLLASRAGAIREIMLWMTKELGIQSPWQYDLAARLCLVGCLAVPDDVFERGYFGKDLSPDEDRMFSAHPARAAQLLSKIPRLEVVTEIVRRQQDPEAAVSAEEAHLGAQMLYLALELDRTICQGMSVRVALGALKAKRQFDLRMLSALETYNPTQAEFETRRLEIRELRPMMVLTHDVLSKDGKLLILKQGTVLTDTWIERLENFAQTRGAQEFVQVRIPKLPERRN